jgi:hypothetical protein
MNAPANNDGATLHSIELEQELGCPRRRTEALVDERKPSTEDAAL